MAEMKPTTGNSDKAKDHWYKTLQGWKAVLEIVAIPFAIAYAIVTFLQWHDLRHNFKTDERPWLEIQTQSEKAGNESASLQLTSGQPVTYPLRIANTGKTAAVNIDSKIFVDIVSSNHEPALEDVDQPSQHPYGRITSGIMFPNSDFNQVVLRPIKGGSPELATEEEVVSIRQGKAYLAVYGIVTYDDISGSSHWTRFCKWIAKSGEFHTAGCTQYNSADNNY